MHMIFKPQRQQIKITMSYKKSANSIHQDRLRLLSFSPDEQISHRSKINKNSSSQLASGHLYHVQHETNINAGSIKRFPRQSKINIRNALNPQMTNKNQQLNLANQRKVHLEASKATATSNCQIKFKKVYMSSTISNHKNYTSSKQAFRTLSKSRIQQEKDLTFLSRTFYQVKKSQEKTKKQLLDSFTNSIEKETRQRQKQQAKRKHAEWLENQKNQNSTKKYMNNLLKYHAKKNLIERKTDYAQQLRSRLKSQESVKSQRSLAITHLKRQRAYMMKVENSQKIQNAKIRTGSRINQRSNSVRNEMAKVYECEGQLEAWRIGQIDEKSRFMLATIENSKKNKEHLQKVLNDSKNLGSTAIFQALKKSLTQGKTNHKAANK